MILIVGRTASGKTLLRKKLEEKGWKFAKTSTTRPKRTDDEDDYYFLTNDEALAIPQEKRFAEHQSSSGRYFVTEDEIRSSDAIIVEPTGVYDLIDRLPDVWFRIVYIAPINATEQRDHAIARDSDNQNAMRDFLKRYNDENKTFTHFENVMAHSVPHVVMDSCKNCRSIIKVINDYTPQAIDSIAETMNAYLNFSKNIRVMIHRLIELDVIRHDGNGMPISNKGVPTPVDMIIETFAEDENLAELGYFVQQYLAVTPDLFEK